MNPISKALDEGYSEDEVLNFVTQAFPPLKNKIQKAIKTGYSAKEIMGFVSNLMGNEKVSPSRTHGMSGQAIQAQKMREDQQKLNQILKSGLSLAGGALAGRAITNAFPKLTGLMSPRGVPKPRGGKGNLAVGEAAGADAQALPPPIPAKPGLKDLEADLAKLNLLPKIETLSKSQPNTESLGPLLSKQLPDSARQELEKKYGAPFGTLVKDYADNFLNEERSLSPPALSKQIERGYPTEQGDGEEIIPEPAEITLLEETPQVRSSVPERFESVQDFKKWRDTEHAAYKKRLAEGEKAAQKSTVNPTDGTGIGTPDLTKDLQSPNPSEEKKTKLVITPDGKVGNLIEQRQGIGTVETGDGKVSRRKLADLGEETPEMEKQITELIESIPEDERSAVLAFASYNPGQEFEFEGKKHNIPMMGVQFHNGDLYMYPGVSKAQFDKVVSKAVKAKTTGENPWHAWTQGKESRGAGMFELIKELEKEFGKNFVKFKASEGYDYFKRIREIVKKIERDRKKSL